MSALGSSAEMAELLDALTEAVVTPPDPECRAEVVCLLLAEMAAMLAWRTGSHLPASNLSASIRTPRIR